MLFKNSATAKRRVLRLLDETPTLVRGNLDFLVERMLGKRDRLLNAAEHYGTPAYLFDREEMDQSITTFKTAFHTAMPQCKIFYAIKSNPHPLLVKNAVRHGLGLDASSGRELQLALDLGAKDILFTGPGKTNAELELALAHADRVTLNLDSVRELEKVGDLAQRKNVLIRAGIRIFTKYHGKWTKFGIPAETLKSFWDRASAFPNVQLQGIQVHMSWNSDTRPYANIIRVIADQLKTFSKAQRDSIRFIDLGGGFLPHRTEGLFPSTLPQGQILTIADSHYQKETLFKDRYYLSESLSLEDYAKGIAQAAKRYLLPLTNCALYFEPGRILSNNAMHVALRVMDVKSPTLAIADGGINMIGFDRFESDYFPLINLTHPARKEIPFHVFGSLCTPHDLWGTHCFATQVTEGDILTIPYQGAYTLTLSQPHFIKPVPDVFPIN